MHYSQLYENIKRGTIDFPAELYFVDENTARYQMPMHWHIEYEMILIRKGSFSLYLNGKVCELNSGDCAWISGGTVHGGTPIDCTYECMVFDLQSLIQNMSGCSSDIALFLSDSDSFTGIYPSDTKESDFADKIFRTMNSDSTGHELKTIGLILQLIGEFISSAHDKKQIAKSKSQISGLKNVLSFIRHNIDKHISLDEMAKIAGMNPKYFCRVFKNMTGKTPIGYLNYFRIESACEMLILTDESITEIAMNCGFNDMSYFSKIFFKEKNISPSIFRKLNRQLA